MSSYKCWALKQPERKRGFLVSWPGFLVIVGIVVIRAFIVLEVVKGDETCFTPSCVSLFSPGGKGQEKRQENRDRGGNRGKGETTGVGGRKQSFISP